jgi:hypothetical protein
LLGDVFVARHGLCALAAAALSGCLPFAVPPARVDVGPTVIGGAGEARPGVRVQAGAHMASGESRRDTDFDAGIGYVFERVELTDAERALAFMRAEPAERPGGAISHGAYVELAHRIARARYHRTWLAVRGERLVPSETFLARDASLGVTGRIEWELYAPAVGGGSDGDGCGFIAALAYGTAAAGFFVESGARLTPDGSTAFVATAGLSVRLPAMVGLVVDLCAGLR